MEAGKSNIKVGTYVKIKGVKGEDSFLNGKRGTVTHPFAFGATGKNWIGIVIDAGQSDMPMGGKCNVKINEIEVIKHGND